MLSPLMSESMADEAEEREVTCAARRAVVELLAQRLKVRRNDGLDTYVFSGPFYRAGLSGSFPGCVYL